MRKFIRACLWMVLAVSIITSVVIMITQLCPIHAMWTGAIALLMIYFLLDE